LVNDKDYYFAVTAYGYGAESIPKALESSINVITVRARQIPMGSTFSSTGLDTIGTFSSVLMKTVAEHTQGISNGYVIPVIVQPDSVIGDLYQIRFDDISGTTSYRIVDVTKNLVLDSNRTHMLNDESYPIRDGIMFKVVDAPSELDYIAVTPSDTALQWVTGWSGAYGFSYFPAGDGGIGLGSELPDKVYYGYDNTLPFSQYKKVEIRLDNSHPSWTYRYRRYADGAAPTGYRFVFQDMVQLPIQAWDVTNALSPIQLNLAFRDQDLDGDWDPWDNPYELMLVCASAYDSTGTHYNTPLIPGGPFETDAMYVLDLAEREGHTRFENANTITIKPYYVNTTNDIYTINTANYKSTAGNLNISKTQIERINAVPNPYFGANAYEHNQFGKVMRITNLPAKAKIRIFSLMGELIRVIDKNDPTTTSVDWDLLNQNNLPVASGMYIVHIDMDAVGTKIIKVAVIMAEERLDNF
jgi:hypothetical protein